MSRKAALDALAQKKRSKKERTIEDEDDPSHYDEFGNLLPCFTDDFIEDDIEKSKSVQNLPPDVEEEEVVDGGEIFLPAAKRAKITVQTTLNNSWKNNQTSNSPVSPQDQWRSLNKSSTNKPTNSTHTQNRNNNTPSFNFGAIPKPLVRHPVAISNSPSTYEKPVSPPPNTHKPPTSNTKVNTQPVVSPPPPKPQTFSFVQVPSKPSQVPSPKSPDKPSIPIASPSITTPTGTTLTPEQLQRIERNRQLALQRLQQSAKGPQA